MECTSSGKEELERIGQPVIGDLLDIIQNKNEKIDTRTAAIWTLGDIRDAVAVPELLTICGTNMKTRSARGGYQGIRDSRIISYPG